jgi:hypothetical protein
VNNVGLPGTGLGGLLYITLALVMPLHEVFESLHGRSSDRRRSLAHRQGIFALAIIGSMGLTWWLLRAVGVAPNPFRIEAEWALMAVVVAFPALLLATLITVIRIWAWIVGRGTVAKELQAVGQ